jgi:hypothetical protein
MLLFAKICLDTHKFVLHVLYVLGHDDRDCRDYDLMHERSRDIYKIEGEVQQEENTDQNLDQGIKFCSNFKVLRMRRKQCHYVCLVFLIPAVYLLFQMDSVWRRYRDLFVKPNRQKKFDAQCTSPYNPYGLTWQDYMIVQG